MAPKGSGLTSSAISTAQTFSLSQSALGESVVHQQSPQGSHIFGDQAHRKQGHGQVWQAAFSSASQHEQSGSSCQPQLSHNHPQSYRSILAEVSHHMPSTPLSRITDSLPNRDNALTSSEKNVPLSSVSCTGETSWPDTVVKNIDFNTEAFGAASDYEDEAFIIMAIQTRGQRVGCAYYDGHTSKLLVLETLRECTPLDMIDTIRDQIHPTLILANSRMEEHLLHALKNSGDRQSKVEIRPSTEFMYDMAKSKLLSLTLSPGFRRHATQLEHHHQHGVGEHMDQDPLVSVDDYRRRQGLIDLSNLIDLDSVESIGCAGALLSYLSRTKALHAVNDLNRAIVLDLAMFSIDSFMYINMNGLSSLQIFEDESHPNIHSCISGRKEGLSLFGILNNTRTPQGRYLLRQWFLRPSLDLDAIQGRQKAIKCFIKPENQPIIDQMMRCLSRIKNIPRVLQAMHRKAQLKDWQSIIQFACYSLKIYSLCHELFEVESPIIHKIRQAFQVQELNEIGSLINDVLDFDESLVEGRCVVKPNVDEELDRMRQTYHGLGSFLSEVAKDISKTIPSYFASTINVVYFPQLGYLIAVPMNPNWKKEDDFYLDGLSYQFSTERAVYYKNSATRELDEHLGDIHGLIVDREIDILQALQERIIEYSHLMILCNDLCAELDALLSLAQAAKLHRYSCPTMSSQTILHIVNGRHPLQELCVESFVPNDTMLGEFHKDASLPESESNSAYHTETTTARHSSFCVHCPGAPETINNNHVMILCGPNCSGKSVYIKQVAMITYMAHIGSFVPADHALIGLTDKILTRLQTRETVSKVHSTFMADLSQVSMALRMATQRSLVVIDEFGKGTATTDGAGLFCAVIEHFAKMESMQRPRVLATTHFHELFENQLMRVSDSSSRLPESNFPSSEPDGSSETAYETTTIDSKPLSSSLLPVNSPGAPLHSVHKASSSINSSLTSTQPLPISIYTMEAVFDDSFHLDNTCDPTIVTASNSIPREPTFLFRVRRGRFPLSLGTTCAITSGLPLPVVQRSIYLSHLFRRYEMVVPDLSRRDGARFEMYERLVSKLLQLKFDTGDLNRHQDGVQGPKEEEDEKENRKVESGLWADIEALLDLAGQVEAFENSGSENMKD